MKIILITLAVLCHYVFAQGTNGTVPKLSGIPSCKRIEELTTSLTELILANELIPDATRYAFHSCIGGCDGCINMNQGDNAGLEVINDTLEKYFNENGLEAEGISRADIWPLAGLLAVNAAIDNHQGSEIEKPCFDFHWGRQACPTSPKTSEIFEFPQPTMNSTVMFAYFLKTFNLGILETVAVMGAHSLGKATRSQNGFDGVWTPEEETTMNTTYFENMIARNLTYKNVDSTAGMANASMPHWQWEAALPSGQVSMMLNTDYEIFFDLELDSTGHTTCKLQPGCVEAGNCGIDNVCPKADTYEQGQDYIKNPKRFYEDFKNAYIKMLQTKTSDLVGRGSTCGCKEQV